MPKFINKVCTPKRDGTTHKVNTPSGVCFVGLKGVLLSIYKRVAHSWGERITFLSYIMMDQISTLFLLMNPQGRESKPECKGCCNNARGF